MPNVWIEALKEYNASKGMWCLPKKGSEEYKEVMAIVSRKKAGKQAKEEPAKKKETSEDRVEKRAKVRAFLEKAILKRREKKEKERLRAESKASRERVMAKIAAYKAQKEADKGAKIVKEEKKSKAKGKGKKAEEKKAILEELERKVKSFMVRGMVVDAVGYRKASEELEEAKKRMK